MSKIYVIAVVVLFLTVSCGPRIKPDADAYETEVETNLLVSDDQQAFFNNLKSLCGQSFKGEQIYRSHHGESWAGREMIMYITECEDDHVYIPFHVDEDRSRTWMFTIEDGQLVFRHQHLHEDGTPEDGSMYGGFANEAGSAFVQYFPADEHTATVIDGGGDNLWIVSMDEALTQLSYRLDRSGEKRFEIVFDLKKPISP
jgi:hypothetical protein